VPPGIMHRMDVVLTRDVDQFAERVEAFLAERIERNVLATILINLRVSSFGPAQPLFAYSPGVGGGSVTAAAIRTPPWPMIASGFDEPGLARELVERWLPEDPELDGVTAEPGTARAVVAAWSALTGGRTKCARSEAMHVLRAVSEAENPAAGELRTATSAERELLLEWERGFMTETGIGHGAQADRAVDRRLTARSQFIWWDEEPVSTAGLNPTVAGTARVGPVYTPPTQRCRGYATAAVAALSDHALASGAEQCMLFTDLANPTSNRIYASIGYQRCGDWEEHRLELRD
jgi:predicted GNAT family acetyltransferase